MSNTQINKGLLILINALGILYSFVLLSTVEPGGILAPARLDLLFNHYALSIMDFRLDIPAFAAGMEGRFMNDGKVYTYYGLLPALLRIPLSPFIDLEQVSVARVMVFLYCVAIGLACQWLVNRLSLTWNTHKQGQVQFWPAYIMVLVWFTSPIVILSSRASQTYEPIALALLLTVIFFAVILDEVLVKKKKWPTRLLLLALLAGLSVHTRPNIAAALYLVTTILVLGSFFASNNDISKRSIFNLTNILGFIGPFLILFLFGMSLLGMNYHRWDSPSMSVGNKGQYGYYAFIEPENSARRESGRKFKLGTFSYKRVLPNTVYHLLGLKGLHQKLASVFQAGHISLRFNARSIILWSPLYLGLLMLLINWKAISRWQGKERSIVLGLSLIGTFLMTYMILSYVAVTYRYKTELWPFLFFSSLIFISWYQSVSEQKKATLISKYIFPKPFLILICVIAMVYSFDKNREASSATKWYKEGYDSVKAQECKWSEIHGWSDECRYLMR